MILGIVIGISIMLVLFLCAFIGYKLGNKPKINKLTEREHIEMKKVNDHFKGLMNYDVEKAYRR